MTVLPDWLAPYLAPYGETARETVLALPADRLAGLRRLAFVLLRPDALVSGRAPALLADLIERGGVAPRRLRVLRVRPDQFDALYQLKLPLFAENVWLHHRIFEAGPAAGLLVAGEPGAHPSLCHRLNALKGSSRAGDDEAADSLRARFGRASSFHAVVHIAADPGAVLAEAPVVFSLEALVDALGEAQPDLPRAPLAVLLDDAPRPGQSVYQALLAVKRKILAALRLRPAPDEAGLERLRLLLEEAAPTLTAGTLSAQRDAFVALARAERAPLTALMAAYEAAPAIAPDPTASVSRRWEALRGAAAPRQMLYAAWFLGGHEPYRVDDGRALFALLAANDVPLFPWQETLVQAALRADANPDARWQGEPLYPG